ncbi:MAG: VWA domain-containing protein [Blastocatellia bacterium]|nr:VWA domain-containing protein [Blastocatellia bacterium]
MKHRSFLLCTLSLLLLLLGIAPFKSASGQDKKNIPPPPLPQTTPKPAQQPEKKAGQDDDDIIKIGTELVNVPFSVTTKQNRYVNDLAKDQIQIFEDGKPEEVFSFTKESDLPLTFALLIDVSGSQELSLPAQKDAAGRFFEKVMRPEKDTAAVITFRRDTDLIQNLTANKSAVLRSLNSIRFSPGSYGGGTPPVMSDPSLNGTSIYDSVFVTSDELLAKEAGRRIILLLTDGDDTTSQYKPDKAIDRALRSEVLIYAIGIPGKGRNGGYVFTTPVRKGPLEKLCEATGGRAFFPEKETDFYAAFQQIEEDLRQQFILSYTPSNATRDGSFRAINIKVQNRPDAKDLKVLSRKGYYAK